MDNDKENSCRTCLQTGPSRSLFEYCPKEALHYHEMIMAFCSVCIKVEDGLSKSICLQCFDDVRRAYAFKKRCEEVNKMLMKNLNAAISTGSNANDIFSNVENYPCEIEKKIIKEEINVDFNADFTESNHSENIIVEPKKEDVNYDVDRNDSSDYTLLSPINVNFKVGRKSKVKNLKSPESIGKRKADLKKDSSNLIKQSKTHVDTKRRSCSLCNFRCERPSALIEHMKVHTKEKPFLCDQCDYTCSTVSNLNVHKTKHLVEKQFMCPNCSFKTKRKGALACHMKTHTGIKEYACDQCSYKSHTLKPLQIHIRMVHTGERPFACDKCPYKTVCSDYLKIHKRVHSTYKRFSCDQCPYVTNGRAHLTVHKRVHSGEKPYSCDSCSFKTATSNSLRRHKQGQHGEKGGVKQVQMRC